MDGYFVQFWRILLRYPELAAWEMLFTDGLRETYAALYKTVKTAKPAIPVGWHIWHNTSFNPIYRAEQDLQELSKYSDFIKVVMYNNCGGERMALYADNIGSTLYGDLSKQALLDFNYAVMGFKERSYEQIPHTGLSADYVYRETKRALEGVAGTKTQIWPGIDIDIPTEPNNSKCTPQSVKEAVLAAFRAGAPGVILIAQIFRDAACQPQRRWRRDSRVEIIQLSRLKCATPHKVHHHQDNVGAVRYWEDHVVVYMDGKMLPPRFNECHRPVNVNLKKIWTDTWPVVSHVAAKNVYRLRCRRCGGDGQVCREFGRPDPSCSMMRPTRA